MPLLTDLYPSLSDTFLSLCSASSTSIPQKAMARNLLGEHRVSFDRLKKFLPSGFNWDNFDAIQKDLDEYQKKAVRVKLNPSLPFSHLKQPLPAFESKENKNNRVNLPLNAKLGTVIDLTRLHRVYGYAAFNKVPAFEKFVHTSPLDQVNEFLAGHLEDPDHTVRKGFVDSIFRAMAAYRVSSDNDRIHPTWAAEWQSLKAYLEPNAPERWVQAVGVRKEHPCWVLVVRYPVKNAYRHLKLFRPTHLDAGWYPHHFPNPPGANVNAGGFTMDLRDADADPQQGLVSEYIHRQIDFEINDWEDVGGHVGFIDKPSNHALDVLRRRHWARLGQEYTEVPTWMPSCI